MFVVLTLMGGKLPSSAPPRWAVPELVRSDRIRRQRADWADHDAAIIAGSVAGGVLFALTGPTGAQHCWISACVLIGVALVGWATSLLISPLPAANPQQRFPLNAVGQTARSGRPGVESGPAARGPGQRVLLVGGRGRPGQYRPVRHRASRREATTGRAAAGRNGVLGVGLGSGLAGVWSAGKIELGMVPWAAGGMAVCCGLLWLVPAGTGNPWSANYICGCLGLLALGFSAGFYDLPLQAFLQQRSPQRSRGHILAAANFVTFAGMLLASGLFWLLSEVLGMSARQIFLLGGISLLPVVFLSVRLLPLDAMRFVVWLLTRLVYRVRVEGLENIPENGGAMLVSNHVSWADAILLGLACPRHVRMIAWGPYFEGRWTGWFARVVGIIPVHPGSRSVVRSIRAAGRLYGKGTWFVSFQRGDSTLHWANGAVPARFLSMMKGTAAPAVPVYLGGLWGSIFSFEGGRFFWKWPRRLPYPVTIHFGRPMPAAHRRGPGPPSRRTIGNSSHATAIKHE